MNRQDEEAQLTADLSALAAVAQGTAKLAVGSETHNPARAAKVAALRARFQAGNLTVDNQALAAKLVDAHIKTDIPG